MIPLRTLAVRPLEFLFAFLARHRLAGLAALALRLSLREFKSIGRPSVARPTTILMLPRVIFTEDVAATFGGTGEFRVLMPPSFAIKALASGILPPLTHTNFYAVDHPELEDAKRDYRAFLSRMWRSLQRHVRIDAVVTGNFGYWAERELAAALEQLGVPFIAMHKESLKTQGYVDFIEKVYRERRGLFTGRRILVYNEIERQLQIDAGVVAPGRITVGGMPRLDRLHAWRRSAANTATTNQRRPQVLFFSFIPKGVLPRIVRKSHTSQGAWEEELGEDLADLSWQELATSTHRAMLQLARETPEITVVVKAKEARRERSGTIEMLRDGQGHPANLHIVVGSDPLELITASDVVCGFNTTALLEAISAGKPVVVPRFAEARDERMIPYVVDLEDAVDHADSPEGLIEKLRAAALARQPSPAKLDTARLRALERWVGNPDGHAGERMRALILAEITGSSGATE